MPVQRLLILPICLLAWSMPSIVAVWGAPSQSLMEALHLHGPLAFCSERVPLEAQEVRERFEKELLLALWDRPQVILWLKRSRRYLPIIEGMLRKAGMPDDLKYVAVAESALRPHAGSHKGAIGFWQFTTYTGRKYGLRIDERFDQRRNIYASTTAAISYFRALYATFGSWTLAAAAFNMGEDGLMAEILAQGTNRYYRLYLPLETQRFVFRILSVKLILSDPQRYGFQLADSDYYPPLRFDHVKIDRRTETPLRIIAQAARTDFKTIKDLNPEIRGHYLPGGSYMVSIPEGASQGFRARFEQLMHAWQGKRQEKVYVVKEGDNLSSIAARFRVPLQALIIWNRLDPDEPIYPGERIFIGSGMEKQ